jgi:hypothetical protein
MTNKTPNQIASRWNKCLNPKLVKGPFTPEEDKMVAKWVADHGTQFWNLLEKQIINRSAKQCRERWFTALDPMLSKKAWTLKEDSIVFNLYFEIGPKWAMIAQCLPGRSDNSIKNRWNSSISKRIEKKLENKKYEEKETRKQKKRKNQFKVARIDTKKQENQESSKLPICDPIKTQTDEEEGIDRSKS